MSDDEESKYESATDSDVEFGVELVQSECHLMLTNSCLATNGNGNGTGQEQGTGDTGKGGGEGAVVRIPSLAAFTALYIPRVVLITPLPPFLTPFHVHANVHQSSVDFGQLPCCLSVCLSTGHCPLSCH